MSPVGTWNWSAETPWGVQRSQASFSASDDGLTGTMLGPDGTEVPMEGLRQQGDHLTWSATIASPIGPVAITVDATISGDAISGEIHTPLGPLSFTGSRGN